MFYLSNDTIPFGTWIEIQGYNVGRAYGTLK